MSFSYYLMFAGYPPLLAYLISVILYCLRNGNDDPGKAAFFFFPQYSVVVLFILFHLLTTLSYRKCNLVTLLLLQLTSTMFSIFAGCSLVSVARYTSGFKLKSELADSLIVGLLLLILIQFYGYSTWPLTVVKKHNESTTMSLTFQNPSPKLLRLIIATFTISTTIGYFGYILYTASAIANLVKTGDEVFTFPVCSNYDKMCKVTQFVPTLLFPLMIVLEALFIATKKKWLAITLFPVGSLFSIFLGYSLYLLIFVLGAYIQGALFNQLSQLGLILFLLQVTGCIIVVITMGFMSFAWITLFWLKFIKVKNTRILEVESTPLISNSSDC